MNPEAFHYILNGGRITKDGIQVGTYRYANHIYTIYDNSGLVMGTATNMREAMELCSKKL